MDYIEISHYGGFNLNLLLVCSCSWPMAGRGWSAAAAKRRREELKDIKALLVRRNLLGSGKNQTKAKWHNNHVLGLCVILGSNNTCPRLEEPTVHSYQSKIDPKYFCVLKVKKHGIRAGLMSNSSEFHRLKLVWARHLKLGLYKMGLFNHYRPKVDSRMKLF